MKMFIKKHIIKITLLVCLFVMIPLNVYATQVNDISMVKVNANNYMIYVKNVKDTFRYTITENSQNTENLNFEVSSEDEKGNNVALLDLTKYNKDAKLSIIIKSESKENIIIPIDKNEYIDFSKLKEINNTTKRIKVKTDEEKVTKKDIKEKEYTVTVNKVVLLDKTKNYEYSLRKIEKGTKEEEILNLVNKINSFDENTEMYEAIETYISLNKLYNELMKASKFSKVNNFEVLQPEEAIKDDKYVLLLKDGQNNDMQILTCQRKHLEGVNEIVEKEKVIKAVKLPVTGDNILLLIGFVLVTVLFIALVVYKKKQNTKK